MIRNMTADKYVENLKGLAKNVGTKTGKLLWVDRRDEQGLIRGDDGNSYVFSIGREGHIGVSCADYWLEGEFAKSAVGCRVEFIGVAFDDKFSVAVEIKVLGKAD